MEIGQQNFCTIHKTHLLRTFHSSILGRSTFGCVRCDVEDYPAYRQGKGIVAEQENALADALRKERRTRRTGGN